MTNIEVFFQESIFKHWGNALLLVAVYSLLLLEVRRLIYPLQRISKDHWLKEIMLFIGSVVLSAPIALILVFVIVFIFWMFSFLV